MILRKNHEIKLHIEDGHRENLKENMGNNACGSCEFVIQKLHIRVNHTEKLCGSCEYVLEIKQEIKLPIEGEHGQKL